MKKYFTLLLLFLIIFPVSAYAHSGRTDANGGHKDKNNVSGLGYYHYHCGGHPAHLHTNGVCPYDVQESNYEQASIEKVNEEPLQEISQIENIGVVRNKNTILINGNKLESDNFIYKDTTYVPLKDILKILNADIKFDKQTFTTEIELQ